MKRIDANIILRYLLGDHDELTSQAAAIIDHEDVFVAMEVICEVVYVLNGVYKATRADIAKQLLEFMRLKGVSSDDKGVASCALEAFEKNNIDFVDAILLAHHKVRGDQIATFDRKLEKLISSLD